MNLIIDCGNTLTKLAVFEQSELISMKSCPKSDTDQLKAFIKKNKGISSVIISSVIKYPYAIKKYLDDNFYFLELNENVPLPIKNKYKTPQTLGKDRLAAVTGANYLYPGENLLVISAGTCITYDFITSKKEYLGGSISPGLSIRYKSLHNFTEKLPLVKNRNFNKLTGQTTEESVLSGVINGTASEIDGMISKYKDLYKNLKVILGGGDSYFFDKRLKNPIFAVPNVVLIGLNVILNHNVKK